MNFTSRKIDALHDALSHVDKAMQKWQMYALTEYGNPDSQNEHLAAFQLQCRNLLSALEDRLRLRELEFAAKPVLRARVYNPDKRYETGQTVCIRHPSRQISEPHIYEEDYVALKTLMGDCIMADEDYDIYVIRKRAPHTIVAKIMGMKRHG